MAGLVNSRLRRPRLTHSAQALRQASDASDVIFSLELSQNVNSKDSLSLHPSESLELLQGAASSGAADIQRLLKLARPQNDFESQVRGFLKRRPGVHEKTTRPLLMCGNHPLSFITLPCGSMHTTGRDAAS